MSLISRVAGRIFVSAYFERYRGRDAPSFSLARQEHVSFRRCPPRPDRLPRGFALHVSFAHDWRPITPRVIARIQMRVTPSIASYASLRARLIRRRRRRRRTNSYLIYCHFLFCHAFCSACHAEGLISPSRLFISLPHECGALDDGQGGASMALMPAARRHCHAELHAINVSVSHAVKAGDGDFFDCHLRDAYGAGLTPDISESRDVDSAADARYGCYRHARAPCVELRSA